MKAAASSLALLLSMLRGFRPSNMRILQVHSLSCRELTRRKDHRLYNPRQHHMSAMAFFWALLPSMRRRFRPSNSACYKFDISLIPSCRMQDADCLP